MQKSPQNQQHLSSEIEIRLEKRRLSCKMTSYPENSDAIRKWRSSHIRRSPKEELGTQFKFEIPGKFRNWSPRWKIKASKSNKSFFVREPRQNPMSFRDFGKILEQNLLFADLAMPLFSIRETNFETSRLFRTLRFLT